MLSEIYLVSGSCQLLLNWGTKAADLQLICKDKRIKGEDLISDPDSYSFIADKKAVTSCFPLI